MHVYAQPETSKTSHATQHIQISIDNQTAMHVNQKSISRPIVKRIQHVQISIGKQTTMHVNQKSISRQIVKQNKLFVQAVRMQAKTQLSRGPPQRNWRHHKPCMSTYILFRRKHNHRYHQDHHVISNQQNIACHTAHSNIH